MSANLNERSPLIINLSPPNSRPDTPPKDTPKPKWSFADYLKMISVLIFTDWPCETVECIVKATRATREDVAREGGPAEQRQGEPAEQRQGEPAEQQQGEPAEQQQGEPAIQQQGEPAEQQQGEPAVQQQGEPAEQQQGEPAVQQQGEPAVQQQGEPAEQQQGEPAVQQQGEPAVQQQGEPAEQQQGNEDQDEPEDERIGCCGWNILCFVIVLLRVLFIMGGTFVQLMTCFRRDRISIDLKRIANDTSEKLLRCDDELFSSLLIPDAVIVLVAIWVYFGLRLGRQCSSGLWCSLYCKWKELNTAMKADTAERLNKLVQAVKSELQKKSIILCYTAIPLFYIVLSQVTSGLYFHAFKLDNKDVVIQPPLGKDDQLAGDVKSIFILLAFAGFISLDLLYVGVIMRYAYRCQMIIYYLQIIKHNILKNDRKLRDNQADEKQKRKCHKEIMDEVMIAHKFLKELNANSATTGFIVIITAFQAANCALMLLDNDITHLKAGAVTLRLALWGFLTMFPFQKAAGVNSASRKLHQTGFDMFRPPPVFNTNPHSSNDGMVINLKATMFGISANPWLPYVVLNLLLLTLMIGSRYKWFEHVHIL